MSLGIIFKGTEGIVLAADSRVTLTTQGNQPNGMPILLQSNYDNASKVLRVNGQNHVGVVTFGLGAIGGKNPRTAHSFMPELEAELKSSGAGRLTVEQFASTFSTFFMNQWVTHNMPDPLKYLDQPMIFLVAGYDDGQPYGKVFELNIPHSPKPAEKIPGMFAPIWGGQREFVDRLISGYDSNLPLIVQSSLGLDPLAMKNMESALASNLNIRIPFQFLPLQDCVDLSVFLIRATINLQKWAIGIHGVGGAIDVATITKTEGFRFIRQKEVGLDFF